MAATVTQATNTVEGAAIIAEFIAAAQSSEAVPLSDAEQCIEEALTFPTIVAAGAAADRGGNPFIAVDRLVSLGRSEL